MRPFRYPLLPGPGGDRRSGSSEDGGDGLKDRIAAHARQRAAARELEGSLISLAAVIGMDVKDSAGDTVGTLQDVVVHWTGDTPHPPVTAIVVRAGKHDALVGARWVQAAPPATVRLRSAAVYAKALERHSGDVALANDVLDRQLIDAEGAEIVRPADLYLTAVDGAIKLVGVEVGMRALLRRLGPRRLRHRVRPGRVIDWAMIRSFSLAHDDGAFARGRRSGLAGQAGAGLELGVAAEELRRLGASDVQAALEASRTAREAKDRRERR